MSDTQSFLCAFTIIMLCTLGATQIVDSVKRYYSEPVITSCSITVRGMDGNKHMYVGQGQLF